jgi:hypothetical protein
MFSSRSQRRDAGEETGWEFVGTVSLASISAELTPSSRRQARALVLAIFERFFGHQL